jgi:hypothetical protein
MVKVCALEGAAAANSASTPLATTGARPSRIVIEFTPLKDPLARGRRRRHACAANHVGAERFRRDANVNWGMRAAEPARKRQGIGNTCRLKQFHQTAIQKKSRERFAE